MKVLVTGGAGFIGSHIVDALALQRNGVLVVDSLDRAVHPGKPDYLRDDVEYQFVDIRRWIPRADIEVIVHCAALGGVARAAREPVAIVEANAGGTAALLAAARQMPDLKRIVHISSFSVYGSNYRYRCGACSSELAAARRTSDLDAGRFEVICGKCGAEAEIMPITAAAIPAPLETYGASKYMQELCYAGFDHCDVKILRLSSVYGQRLRLYDGEATIIAKLAGWIKEGRSPELLEDGNQKRDWVYVGDVVDTVMALLHEKAAGKITNVCSGVPTTLKEACARISEVCGHPCEPVIRGGYRPGDMRHCLGDSAAVESILGRKPVAFDDGCLKAF